MKAGVVAVCASEPIERNRRLLTFSLPFAVAAVLMACFVSSGHLTLHLLLFLCGLAGIWLAVDASNPYRESLMAAYTTAYALRLLWIMVIAQAGLDFTATDDRTYDSLAQSLTFSVQSPSDFAHLGSAFGSGSFGYPLLLTLLYRTLGHSLLSAKSLNALFGAGTVLLAYMIIEDLSGDLRLAVAGAWIAAWFGFDIAMTAWLFKDTVLMFLYTLAIAGTIRATKRKSFIWAAAAMFGVLAAFPFRSYTFGEILIGAAAAILATAAGRLFPGGLFKQWVVFLVMIGTVAVGAWLALDVLAEGGPLADFIQTAHYVERLQDSGAGQAIGFQPLRLSLTPGAVRELIEAVLRYFLSPLAFVFKAPHWRDYFIYPGMVVIYVLLPFAAAGVWDRAQELRPAALFAFVPALVHASIEIYVYRGGANRQRMMTDILFVAAACMGWKARKKHPLLITAAYLGFLPVIYFQAKLQGN